MKEKRICKGEGCTTEITKQGKSGYCISCVQKVRLKDPRNHPMFGKLGDNCPNYKHGLRCREIKYTCTICGEKVSDGRSKLCLSCAQKGERGNGFIDGRTLKKYYCIESDCNNEIDYKTWRSGGKRCLSCAMKDLFKKPESHPNFKGGKPLCIDCGKELANYDGTRCQSCSSIGELGSMSGKRHTKEAKSKQSLKKGGTGIPYENSEYPAEFDDILKYDIRTRDSFICKLCGITEKEHLFLFEKVLCAHHIDYNKQNCDKSNLITLCSQCNFEVNKNRPKWTNYFKEKLNGNTNKPS